MYLLISPQSSRGDICLGRCRQPPDSYLFCPCSWQRQHHPGHTADTAWLVQLAWKCLLGMLCTCCVSGFPFLRQHHTAAATGPTAEEDERHQGT